MNKAIITVVGQDTVGIIARVCTYLSGHHVNVLDISQTIIDGFFNMMMIVDYANADKDFGAMVGNLEDLGDDIGVLSYKSRMHVIGDDVLDGVLESLKITEQKFSGLVIWQT